MAIIFLDVDGVLNGSRSILEEYEESDPTLYFARNIYPPATEFITPLEKSMIANLKWLIDSFEEYNNQRQFPLKFYLKNNPFANLSPEEEYDVYDNNCDKTSGGRNECATKVVNSIKIVFTSTWRQDETMRTFLVKCLQESGIDVENVILGDTPILPVLAGGRGMEIMTWIERNVFLFGREEGQSDHKEELHKLEDVQSKEGNDKEEQMESHLNLNLVVLDDDHEQSFFDAGLSKYFVKTICRDADHNIMREGLTREKAEEALRRLKID